MSPGIKHDAIALLLQDHRQVEELFAQLEGRPDQWGERFGELTETLVRHEVAEETAIYPVVRSVIIGGDRLADERIAEQSEAEELLKAMEKTSPDRTEFASQLATLRAAVLQHAAREEETVFGPLGDALSQGDRAALGDRYLDAKSAAPTHPHPHAPDTPPGNTLMGPVAAIIDRVRDAIRSS